LNAYTGGDDKKSNVQTQSKDKGPFSWREGKVEDAEEVFKASKALEAQIIKIKDAKNKARIVAHMMKVNFLNPSIDEESDVVVSKKDMHDTHIVDLFVLDLFSSIPTI